MASPMPPMLRGLPVVGNFLDYRRDHVEVFWRGYRAFGRIFSIQLGPQRAAVILGPENHRFFFTEVDNILSMNEVYKFVIPMFGKILNAAETKERKEQLAILRRGFQGKQMRGYVETMVQETVAWLETLGDEGQFELWESLERLSMHIASATLMGQEFRQRIDAFLPLYHDLANGMEFVLPPNLPLPRFRRRDRARRQLSAMIRPLIAERRARPEGHDDFMQTLAHATYSDGTPVPDDLITGLVLMTVFGAYETTTAQNCWTLIQLLQHPSYLASVREEQDAVLSGEAEAITADSLQELVRLEWALKETERMRPVFSHYARYTAVPYDLGGYHVPKGWLTIVCPAVSHRLPEVFPDPDRYDPERFSPARAEDRGTPFSLVGFGGGFYICPGMRFGTLEMKVILSLLLQAYALELVDPDPQPDYEIGIIRPKPPCYIKYRRVPHVRHRRPALAALELSQSCPYGLQATASGRDRG